MKSEDEFIFELVEGGTILMRKTKSEVGGFFKMAEPLVSRMMSRQFDTNFANLKDLLEIEA